DYWVLNAMTVKNHYSLPLISELINNLWGAQYFTKLDVSSLNFLTEISSSIVCMDLFTKFSYHYCSFAKSPQLPITYPLWWSTATYSVFWSECVMVHKQMGCSPYYATSGTHSLLPADIVEATYLQPPPNSLLSTTDLIVHRAINLQCHQEDLNHLHSNVLSAHHLATIHFEAEHTAMICDYNFQGSELVLMRNTRIEVTHNKKMKPCYLGPLVVISRNHGSTYIFCKLDGSVLHCPIAAFRLVPYFAREHIPVLSNAFDIDTS
ncbi:hypothetical protein J132_04941, partial [Termitomyces sp. J132]